MKKTSEWRAERNRMALARLHKALPDIFPPPVLTHALNRPFIPPMPRRAVDALARAPVSGGPARAGARAQKRHAGRLDMAARNGAQAQSAGNFPVSSNAVS